MEPNQPMPEQAPQPAQITGESVLPVPEFVNGEPSPERMANNGDGAAQGAPAMPIAQTPVDPVAAAVNDATATAPQQQDNTIGATPAGADDVDVIEKEWVNKAKQIVDAGKDDPHKKSKQVTELKADYLRKRFGKELPQEK